MRRLFFCFISGGLIASVLAGAPAFAAGNIKNGKALAEQWCANCHIVDRRAPNAAESQPVGPDFMSVKGLNASNLRVRLRSPHPVMSNFPELSDQQVADLVAYIGSVAK